MQQQTFDYMLEEIYGAFGRQRPSYGSPAYRAIERRVNGERPLPDDAAKYIAEAMADYDSLPSNLGKAIMAEFFNWLSEHPEKRQAQSACPDCSKGLHGWFWIWTKDGLPAIAKCSCNRDPRFAKFPAMTRKQAKDRGYMLENPDAGNWGAIGCLDSVLGDTGSQRPDHQRALEEVL